MQQQVTVITRATPKKDRAVQKVYQGGSKGQIKYDGYNNIMETFDTLLEIDLIELDPEELEAIENCNGRPELLTMLLQSVEGNENLMHITLDELIRLPYYRALAAIRKFPMIKRIEMLQTLEETRLYIYEFLGKEPTSSFASFEKGRLTTDQRMRLYGKLKHLEILLAWLFGIEDVAGEEEKKWVTAKR